jgi:hypothetical protein
MMAARRISRRDFVVSGSAAAAVGLAARRAAGEEEGGGPLARVVLVRDRDVLDEDGSIRPDVLRRMLNDAVAALMRTEGSDEAWRRLLSSLDVVGIKSNEWRYLPTPPALEEAIRSEVLTVGVTPDNIDIDDRTVKSSPVFRRATAIINVRPMRTHHWSGLGTCLKNLITFTERYPDYHPNACAPLGSIWLRPELRGKVRLNVLVMLTPQFHSSGPHSFSRQYVWPYRGLIVGVDPVAVDATGARIITAQRARHFGDQRPILPPPHHIEIAETRYGVGVSDPSRIEIVRLGWQDEALI